MLAAGMKPYHELGLEKARQQSIERTKVATGFIDYSGDEWEVIVPSPYSKDGIPVTVFKPSSAPEVPAILVIFPRWRSPLGESQTERGGQQDYCKGFRAIVLNVEYRLLPDPVFPFAPFDDGVVVTKWVLENKEAVGGKPRSKVGIGVDSAGGQLSASVTNDVLGLDFQVLVYPMTDTTLSSPSFKEFEKSPILGEGDIKWALDLTVGNIPDYSTNPRANLMKRTNTRDSPPALVILSELDPFRDCGLEYADKLRTAGVTVQCEVIKGVPHAFFILRTCSRRYALKHTTWSSGF
ncbi:unnamed protein product [Lymnaea stagnalis]|uniref:Alpha/beta hydrolase fold-3 domain-containing protein n=1 Tax=Lymnaea stagnalis TaxID=6523 RepID=A0AAV2I9S1_LYMST